jgi:hypothetical protein
MNPNQQRALVVADTEQPTVDALITLAIVAATVLRNAYPQKTQPKPAYHPEGHSDANISLTPATLLPAIQADMQNARYTDANGLLQQLAMLPASATSAAIL